MKSVLNVKGTKLSVLSIHRSETGKLLMVHASHDNGHETCFVDKLDSQHFSIPHVAIENLEGALEYPEVEARITEERNKLIHHLEQMQREENEKLIEILTEMGEMRDDYPFERLGERLATKQREYRLAQQRVFGIIDAIEEIKAYTEGYFANVDSGSIETQSSH